MDTGLSHPVEAVASPFEDGLHSSRVVELVILPVVGFLETDDPVEAVVAEFGIFLGLQWHYLYLDVREIFLGNVDRLCQIGDSSLGGILSRDQEDVLERSQLLDGLVFVLDLFGSQDDPGHWILPVKPAVDAGIAAGIGDVQRDEHRHCASESLACVFSRQHSHRLQIRFGSRRQQGHEVIYVAAALSKSPTDIGIGLGCYHVRRLVPAVALQFI